MSLFDRKKSGPWSHIKDQSFSDSPINRDVHSTQNLERGSVGKVESSLKEKIGSLVLGLLLGLIGYIIAGIGFSVYDYYQSIIANGIVNASMDFSIFTAKDLRLIGISFLVFLCAWGIIYQRFMMSFAARNSMADTTDINSYENDQHILLVEEAQEKFDFFPDAGAHASPQVSSMLSHNMISRKGIKKVPVVQRYEQDVIEDGTVIFHKGDVKRYDDGTLVMKNECLIDEDFGQELFSASGIPRSEKDIRSPYDVRDIKYNPKDDLGNRIDREKQPYDTVIELVNADWVFPEYEVQRPAGAYLVDTAPVNTMVLAITRAGKGQTYIEPVIDMWTRELRQNNIVINDPKGELLVKFFVPAAVRGYEIVQFNLINPLNTDIYNPLCFAAEAAREGDFTKAASYIENIGDIFFPKDGADDPMWPNAANNAFKRSAFGLIDYYLEEEKQLRFEAELHNIPEKILSQQLDDIWGKVTLYNAYQLFVVLSAKKSDDPDKVSIEPDEQPKEKDFLTLFFDATAALPQNEMRKLVQNTDNALRAMGGSDKTIASVYGIALTAMSFFTDPTISTLTSGKPSQNFDSKGLSFPRRVGVRFASEFLDKKKFVGLQAVWDAYSDIDFTQRLDPKLFGHQQIIDREGWARYYFDGKFENRKSYLRLRVIDPKTNLLVGQFYFEIELTYKTDLLGRRYIKDPVLNEKVIKDGVLREMVFDKEQKKYIFHDNMIKRRYKNLADLNQPEKMIKIPIFVQKSVKYSERPKAVFFITPPHLMNYAKLILILIKQMVDVNFEGSYLTKENQKPLYKTRYMMDEVGNLQSEGQGIPALQTMLSIGLGQDQQFTLILQTLQQLRDVYGENVDKIIQGNVENIIFLKSTDDSMIDTLVKMSGTTHESRIDQKTITKDNERLLNQNEGRISYTMQTKERPTILFNDFMFIKERNSIVLKAGSPPLWNRNQTVYPMSYRLLQNTIKIPGKKFSLQTIPTNSSAKDFDVRKNQPNFFAMLEKRCAQAKLAVQMKETYMEAYDYDESTIIKLDQNVVSDDIMKAINDVLFTTSPIDVEMMSEEELNVEFDEYGMIVDKSKMFDGKSFNAGSENNDELEKEYQAAKIQQDMHQQKRYAGGLISRDELVSMSGAVIRQLDLILALAYNDCCNDFSDTNDLRVNPDTRELSSSTGVLYVKDTRGRDHDDVQLLNDKSCGNDNNIYSEDTVVSEVFYEVTDAFIKYLASLDSWSDLANGRFELAFKKNYERKFC